MFIQLNTQSTSSTIPDRLAIYYIQFALLTASYSIPFATKVCIIILTNFSIDFLYYFFVNDKM